MAKSQKQKQDIPEPPKIPSPALILEDLKAADNEDPAFFESTDPDGTTKPDDHFQVAREFMMTTTKLTEFNCLLATQKSQLEKNYEELCVMSENIRKQAEEALSNIYSNKQNF